MCLPSWNGFHLVWLFARNWTYTNIHTCIHMIISLCDSKTAFSIFILTHPQEQVWPDCLTHLGLKNSLCIECAYFKEQVHFICLKEMEKLLLCSWDPRGCQASCWAPWLDHNHSPYPFHLFSLVDSLILLTM